MTRRCPGCGATVRCERSERPNRGPVRGEPVVDLWFRCGGCGLRVDASGVGEADAEADLDRRLRDTDRTRKLHLMAEQRDQRRGRR